MVNNPLEPSGKGSSLKLEQEEGNYAKRKQTGRTFSMDAL